MADKADEIKGDEVSAPKAPKRVTLQDIAEVAGVQKMVVSNALNGTRRVAPETREKIRRIAREMNYIPNFAARALTSGRTGIIAVLSGPLNEPYYATMVHFLETHLAANGFKVLLMRTPHEVRDLVNATGNLAVDGTIAVDMLGLVREFRSHPTIPCVFISTNPQSYVDNVIIDLSPGVDEAMNLILASGRRRIAYLVTAQVMACNTEVRARTYRAAMKAAHLAPEIINVSTDDVHLVEAKLTAYFQSNDCPQALLCQNDESAMCAFHTLRQLGHKIPDDVLLVGCDGQRYMGYFDPPLSTIVQPIEELCALACQFLQQRIANPDLPHQEATLHGKLLVRQSLIAPPTASVSRPNSVC